MLLIHGLQSFGLPSPVALWSSTLVLFVIGIVILVKGADTLVIGSSSIAKRFKLSDMIIGLTIVAFGTSAPELVVNISSSLKGATGVTLGNVLGSNIVNILLILGCSAVIAPLHISKKLLTREVLFMFVATILVFLMVNDILLDGTSLSLLTRSEGLMILLLFPLFLYFLTQNSSTKRNSDQILILPLGKSILFVILGLAGLLIGGERIVNGAIWIAQQLGISERIIGLTIIAIGTSLPELATSIMASLKGENDIAVGNVVGSNIFNILFILGASASITTIPIPQGTNVDLYVLLLAIILVFIFGHGFLGKKEQMTKTEGILLLLIYVSYLAFLIFFS